MIRKEHLPLSPIVFTSGALKVGTSLYITVKVLNHLTSVMFSYLTAVSNPPHPFPHLSC